ACSPGSERPIAESVGANLPPMPLCKVLRRHFRANWLELPRDPRVPQNPRAPRRCGEPSVLVLKFLFSCFVIADCSAAKALDRCEDAHRAQSACDDGPV